MAPTLQALLKGRAVLNFILPAAAITGALTIGAPSAKALTGSAAFSGITADFASQVNVNDGTDTFSVLFNPVPFTSTVVGATGVFIPPFTGGADFLGVTSPTVLFTYEAPVAPGAAFYTIGSNASFTYSNGVTIGLFAGDRFLVSQGAPVGGIFTVNVDLQQNRPPAATAFVNGLSVPVVVTGGGFTFQDTSANTTGSYSGQVDVSTENVPGPLPILGAGIAFGYSRRLRKRVKSAAVSA
ncbi:hypothetical protein KBZ08_00510 [Cyanobium sp. Candia 9D4]|jgi:hypothetical protein|uniref:hypothetical protein n=1 Tax=Cyanobium sp. Candia 9D4 TaxID=2823707 RepID=UPI0020CF3A7D|nr:hypothetical protein [Cyanobium sp. Candia 9D4]MCP9932390.1 hypothetical protein [Cyanobium sp. Candia 9D4]